MLNKLSNHHLSKVERKVLVSGKSVGVAIDYSNPKFFQKLNNHFQKDVLDC